MMALGPSLFLLTYFAAPLLCQDECDDNSCHPQLGDLMVGRSPQLSASSTCGLEGPQNYCILGYLEDEQKCFLCDSRTSYNSYHNPSSHRIENVITAFEGSERKMKWWQSENGVHRVSIKLDLETVFQFSHLVLTFKSFRPAAMLVERSKDFGQTWKVFRYFAENCQASFPGVSEEPADSLDDVICDSRYSGLEPSTDGEVVLKALDPRFQIDDPYDPKIQELITITNLRVNFTRLLTLGDTLLSRRRRSPQDKYYYALYEMVVRGSCFCNGHASQCMPVDNARGDAFSEPGMVHGRCVCQHHTVGYNCERCEDFYNDAPWRPSGTSNPQVCRKCNCHGHSERCHFDMGRFVASGEVSGGVCEDCRSNRVGAQCEQCQTFFYQDPSRSMEDPEACVACDCDPAGSLDNGLCDAVTGRCVCKENVEGERCDRCKYAFYGLRQDDPSGCQFCQCNLLGSITAPHSCDQVTGQCFCQHFATGAYCDQCVSGYWGLGNTVYSCLPCDCDIGGSTSSLCSSVDGQCPCRPNMVGLSCSNPAPGHYLAPLDYYIYEAEDAEPLDSTESEDAAPPDSSDPEDAAPPDSSGPEDAAPLDSSSSEDAAPPDSSSLVNPLTPTGPALPKCEQYYREQGYDFILSDGQYVLTKREKRSTRQRRQDQYVAPEPGQATQQVLPRERRPGFPVTWTGPGFMRAQHGAVLRFTVPNIPAASLQYHLLLHYEPQSSDDWSATIRVVSSGPLDYGRCPNVPSTDMYLTLSATNRVARLDSTVCLEAGVEYSVDVTLRRLSSPDSQSSRYILIDSLGLVPQVHSRANPNPDPNPNPRCLEATELQQYRCVELLQAGTPPEQCKGLVSSVSALVHNGAIPCDCNSEGAYRETCAKFGGQCECKPNVIGRCCDSCAPLTYGFGPNGCTACECDSSGSTAELCDGTTGQCPCRAEVTGRHCDQCLPGHYGFPQCSPCQCNGLADLCDPVSGACQDCRGHSTGHTCDRCIPGYYGDPVFREPCEPCTCPDVEDSGRFFALSCSKDDDTGSLACDCLRGHEGARCDSCAPGFYGDLALPGAQCEECRCNNNTDPRDADACDTVTGDCLRCLHNTQGSSCERCRPGYYGDALVQDCKECSCDRRGTEVTRCPLDSPCFCDEETGQCPCRGGVIGPLCNECDDGYWNLDGDSGCQPCKCERDHSLNNTCDKITGQCPCLPEYGGQQCYECAENYFGDPDVQCLYCDCNMEGTLRPACAMDTGECRCRPGVMGILCDECAPGHESVFPECQPCHPCSLLWAENVTDVKRAAEKMRTLVPKPGDDKQPAHGQRWQRVLDMQSQLEAALNMTGDAQADLDAAEDLYSRVLKLKDSIDPSVIIIDPTSLLNTEIDNIKLEFQKVIDKLIEKTKEVPITDPQALNDTLEEVRQHYKDFIKDEERVKDADAKLDSSRELRQKSKLELSKCHTGDWDTLEKKIKALTVTKLNENVCGAPGDADCSEARCGGALCQTDAQKRKCGGPGCRGSVPVSHNASETAEKTENDILDLLHKLRDSAIKINEAKDMNEEIKDEAVKMKQKITDSKSQFEKEKNGTKDLLKKVKDYLTDEMVKPEDIEKMAKAVLAIQLPSTPDEIQTMIQNIRDVLANFTDFKEDLELLKDKAKTAEELREQAEDVKNRTKNIDVSDIRKTLQEADQLHDKVSDGLDVAKANTDEAADKVKKTDRKLDNIEALLSPNVKGVLDDIEALKKKTEMNRVQAEDALAAAEAALKDATDVDTDVKEVIDLFETLKDTAANQTVNDEVSERVKNITAEVESLAKDVADKMKKIEDLEKRFQKNLQSKEDKENDVARLLEEAADLRREIGQRADAYLKCTS
ncbi:laminin subunit beta-4 [Clupea harengus]|uniref:Laminin subunit beta-4 n=1 Tax=Clupea harengus TaxID=7950 RepID=A0A6P8EN44_CLUHA|nr:laminin subunit beta-4 [Clupea harengus]